MGNSAPAKSSLIRERLKGKILTAAECREIADRKMGEAVGDRRHGKELKATAQAFADKVDLDGCARLICAGAADTHPPRSTAAAGEVDRDAPARRFGRRLRRYAVAIGGSGEDGRRRGWQLGQGDGKRTLSTPRIRWRRLSQL